MVIKPENIPLKKYVGIGNKKAKPSKKAGARQTPEILIVLLRFVIENDQNKSIIVETTSHSTPTEMRSLNAFRFVYKSLMSCVPHAPCACPKVPVALWHHP